MRTGIQITVIRLEYYEYSSAVMVPWADPLLQYTIPSQSFGGRPRKPPTYKYTYRPTIVPTDSLFENERDFNIDKATREQMDLSHEIDHRAK